MSSGGGTPGEFFLIKLFLGVTPRGKTLNKGFFSEAQEVLGGGGGGYLSFI